MKRTIYEELLRWKAGETRKPLVLKGARQTGKTHILSEFGKKEFRRFHYVNFQKDRNASAIFGQNLAPEHIIESLEFYPDATVDFRHDLVFFDEIQDAPNCRIRISGRNPEFNEEAHFHNYPLYLAGRFPMLVSGSAGQTAGLG